MIRWGADGDRVREFEGAALVHLDALYRFALRLTHNRAEAEDMVQETCLRAFRNFHRFNAGTNCRAWLFTILRNVFLNRLRQAGRETPVDDSGGWESMAASVTAPTRDNPEEEFFQTVLHGDVDRALKALPLPFRETVVLADLEGFSYKEVSEVLGCPIGTVMSRLSRGRNLLRQALAGYAREHGYVKEPE
ncbi:MAG: sigma-70 family RNA polymerase sigma factor [Candidatus Rokubacteria bacterium]|nr:sigma-70 family RNA polymerase sigma factor [Candidatus Rokubacteria bacterium]